jgi:hypothetical protein
LWFFRRLILRCFGNFQTIEQYAGSDRTHAKTKRLLLNASGNLPRLMFDRCARVFCEVDLHGLTGVSGCLDVGLNQYGSIFERRLADRDVRDGDVPLRFCAADNDRIDGRRAGQIIESLAHVRGVAVGHQQHARHRLATVSLCDRSQGHADCRRFAAKVQFGKVRRSAKSGIEHVLTNLKVVGQSSEPVGLVLAQCGPKDFSAALVGAPIPYIHPAAIVGYYQEQVRAGLSAFAAPQRFGQAEHQQQDAQQFQAKSDPVGSAFRWRAAVRPDKQQKGRRQQRPGRPQPSACRYEYRSEKDH